MRTDEEDVYSTDAGKRKKGKDDEFAVSKSHKIKRTPSKTGITAGDEKLDVIINMIKDLTSEVKEIRKEHTTTEQQDYKKEMKALKEENKKLREENEEIKREMKVINEKLEDMDKRGRKNNIIVTGLKMETHDPEKIKEVMGKFLEQHLEIKVDVKDEHKIGPKTCILELNKFQDKKEILKNKTKLKNVRSEKVFINSDRTKTEREIEKTIRKIAKEERDKGKRVQIGYQKLTIDEEIWTWDPEKGDMEIKRNNSKN